MGGMLSMCAQTSLSTECVEHEQEENNSDNSYGYMMEEIPEDSEYLNQVMKSMSSSEGEGMVSNDDVEDMSYLDYDKKGPQLDMKVIKALENTHADDNCRYYSINWKQVEIDKPLTQPSHNYDHHMVEDDKDIQWSDPISTTLVYMPESKACARPLYLL